MDTMKTPQERLKEIVKISYSILCNKIAYGDIKIANEASLQMQFGVILKQVGQLYEFAGTDRFSIELEAIQPISPTTKSSKGQARCDISLRFSMENNDTANAIIELKHFKYDKTSEAVADNRFAIMKDIENLEHYKEKDSQLLCYEILYTDNKNYANPHTTAGIKLAPIITQCFTYCQQTVELKAVYEAEWSNHGNKYFMIVTL
ncbi:MAG: hypothetical protein IJZ09_02185 [Tidjanibacter sp.]|nr:hypothetical protein [Tidjanibacter sp.]